MPMNALPVSVPTANDSVSDDSVIVAIVMAAMPEASVQLVIFAALAFVLCMGVGS